MPTYTFRNKTTNEQFDIFIKMINLDQYKLDNPDQEQIIGTPNIVSGITNSKNHKVPSGFKDVLSKVAEAHPTSEVGKTYGNKTAKQIKTEQIVAKHIGKANV